MQDHGTDTLFGMEGFRVLVVDDHEGVVNVLVELERPDAPCPGCGTFSAAVKERPVVQVADAPAAGRPLRVFWRKRRLVLRRGLRGPRASPSRRPTMSGPVAG